MQKKKRARIERSVTMADVQDRKYGDLHRILIKDPHYHDDFLDDPNKCLEKLMYESMLVVPGLDQLDPLHPAMTAESWDGMDVPPEYRVVNEHLRGLIVTDEKKVEYMQRFKDHVDLEADLPSCCACGIRMFPSKSGLEKPLSQPLARKSWDKNHTFRTFSISDPVLNELKVTNEQEVEHAGTNHLRSVFSYERQSYHLHPHLVLPGRVNHEKATADDMQSAEPQVILCNECANKLEAKKPSLPKYSIANGWDFGRLDHMPPLSTLEKIMIAKVVCFGSVVKLKEQRSVSQQALHGQIIAFPHNGADIAAELAEKLTQNTFPFHSNDDLLRYIKVSFVGPEEQALDYIKVLMLPKGPLYWNVDTIVTWLTLLKQTHPEYANLVLPSKEQLDALFALLEQLFADNAQVVSDETARFMDRCFIGRDVANVRTIPTGTLDPTELQRSIVTDDADLLGVDSVPVNVTKLHQLPLVMSEVVIVEGGEDRTGCKNDEMIKKNFSTKIHFFTTLI